MNKFRGRRLIALAGSVLLLATACGGGTSGGEADDEGGASGDLKLATLDVGSSWFVYGGVMANLIGENSDLNITPLPQAGGTGNPSMVSQGQAELGLGFTAPSKWAFEGEEPFDEPLENLRALAGGFDQYYMGIVATEKSGITSLRDVVENEQAIDLVVLGAGTMGELGARHVLEAHGASYEDIESWGGSVSQTTQADVVSRFSDNRADVFMQVVTKGHPGFTEVATTAPVKFVSLDDEAVDFLVSEKGWSAPATMPAGLFPGQDEPFDSVGFQTMILASEDLPEETAYTITKILCENPDRLVQGAAALEAFDPKTAWQEEKIGIPLHPGAERYFEEEGHMG